MKEQGAGDRALEWETGPAADALERFKTDTIHSGILAKVIYNLWGLLVACFAGSIL